MQKNHYEMLGVSKDATDKEIRQAYRRLARKYHPDVNGGDKKGEARFKEINEAYAAISEPAARKRYDESQRWSGNRGPFGSTGEQSPFTWVGRSYTSGNPRRSAGQTSSFQQDAGVFGNLFSNLFGVETVGDQPTNAPRNEKKPELELKISLEDAYQGGQQLIRLYSKSGSKNQYDTVRLDIPKGIETGAKINLPTSGPQKGLVGSKIKIIVQPHGRFRRTREDLHVLVTVPMLDLVLGGEVEVSTIKGTTVILKLPPETQNGQTFRLKGQGMPKKERQGDYGDLLAKLEVELPIGLTDVERDLFLKMRDSAQK